MAIDEVWESSIYGQGKHLSRYPYDSVVSFVFRHMPRDRPRAEIGAIEVGFGGGNNVWFMAREGLRVAGIEGSPSAVAFAQKRLADEGLQADLRQGDFRSLPWEDGSFDLAVDRGSITCCGFEDAQRTVAEVRRVLRPGGSFFFNPYSAEHTSASSGRRAEDGRRVDIDRGTLTGVGGLAFWGPADVDRCLDGWDVIAREHLRITSTLDDTVHAEWRLVLRRR